MKKVRDRLLKTFCRTFVTLQNPKPQMEDLAERYSYNPVLRWNPQVEEYFMKAYGAEHFALISRALTHPSGYSCIRVNTLKSTTNTIIEKLSTIVKETGYSNFENTTLNGGDVDVNGIELMQSGSQRASVRIEDEKNPIGKQYQHPSISRCQVPGLDYVVFVRGSGPHTIDYGYANGRPPKEVIVSRKCAEAVLRGAQVYVPGVMACSAHVERGDVVAVSVAVEQPGLDGGWSLGITRGTVVQGLPTDPYHSERSGLYIGQGTTALSRAGIFRVTEGIAVDMNNRVFKLPSFHDVLEGEIFLQNLPSIVTAHALDPQKGERILDMCAAPGGKTTAIAILMKDEGEVIAADRSHNKVMDIQKLAAEMGLSCITTYKLDALKSVNRKTDSCKGTTSVCIDTNNGVEKLSATTEVLGVDETIKQNADLKKNGRRPRNGPGRNKCVGGRVENSKGFAPNSFDRVLLDAPCSALGLRPRLFAGEETIASLKNHAKYQRRMFDQAVQLVRPGGVIVYSTCTINPGENEALVRYALDTYKFLTLAPQHPRIGGPGLVGHFEFADHSVEEWLRPGEEHLVQRFDPSSPLDTIGFFIAKFSVGSKDSVQQDHIAHAS
ncbi:putative methyltransferase NSUN6 [Momordica charantia]|uniref:Methyltransferase NSUN6 n=1 Tax=Momordica charantia TaxID=3673 RepID=A0A6J1C4S1_MOMCH|nr:putative methyltransferase NSUN6 [Momordica charantia]